MPKGLVYRILLFESKCSCCHNTVLCLLYDPADGYNYRGSVFAVYVPVYVILRSVFKLTSRPGSLKSAVKLEVALELCTFRMRGIR